jgi:DNA polymerase III delta subunit
MVILFIGQDSFSKDARFKAIKKELLEEGTEQFNLDILHAGEISVKDLQEKLLCLPVEAKQRIILLKGCSNLKKDTKDFLSFYVKKAIPAITLVLDFDQPDSTDTLITTLKKYSRVFKFSEKIPVTTFTLSRQIDSKKAHSALSALNQLLLNGEKPERIMGGLRYVWERERNAELKKKRLGLLLECDKYIKTGKLRPDFALEKLIIELCSFREPFG